MSLSDRLAEIERKNNNLLQEKNRLEGRIEALKQKLKSEFDTDNVEDLQQRLVEMKASTDKMQSELEASIEKMEAQIGISDSDES
jgi:uncharacterized coiled-coil protein SlyX